MNVLEFTMGLNARPFADGAAHVKQQIREIKESVVQVGESAKIGEMLGVLGVSFAAFKSLEGGGEAFREIFEQGKQLRAEAKATGESITNLITIQKAYQEVGMDPGSAVGNMAMLQNALGGVNAEGEPTKKIFDQLGLSMDRLKSEDYPTQLKEIGVAIGGLATQSDKMAAVRAIFGRQGANMINILADPRAIEEAAKSTAEKAAIYEKNAALFTQVTNEFEVVQAKTKGFFLGAAEGAAQGIIPVLDEINSLDTIKIGDHLGNEIKAGLGAFKFGQLSDLISADMQVGGDIMRNVFAGAVNSFSDGFESVCKTNAAALLDSFNGPIRHFQALVEKITNKAMDVGSDSQEETLKEGIAAHERVAKFLSGNESIAGRYYLSLVEKEKADLNTFQATKVKHDTKSVDEIAAENKEAPSIMTVDGPKTAADFRKETAESGRLAGETFIDTVKGNNLNSAVSAAQITIDSAKRQQVADRYAAMVAPRPEETAAAGGKKFSLSDIHGGDDSASGKAHEIASDRLAKIGGFIGQGGPANDHARRTADATAAMAQILKTIASNGLKIATQINAGAQASSEAFAYHQG